MKIAVTYENGKVFGHFGHTQEIKTYIVDADKIISEEMLDLEGKGHELIVDVLSKNNVDTLICGGIGKGAKDALEKAGIKLYGGVEGNADESVKELLNGTLKYNANVECEHHEHHEEGHTCSKK